MTTTHQITRGFDIRLAGRIEDPAIRDAKEPLLVAVEPPEFPGVKPKLLVKEGDQVATGQALFLDKNDRALHFVSPATGKVSRIVFGERRYPLRIEITPGTADDHAPGATVGAQELGQLDPGELIARMKRAGLWQLVRQRPLGKVAYADREPSAVWVNGMDTEPLAADPARLVAGAGDHFRLGLELLRRASGGVPVYLTVAAGAAQPDEFRADGVEVHAFGGPHPAGLVGTHIRMVRPLQPDQRAWYLKAPEVALLGQWVATGRYPTHRVVAVAGSSAPQRGYFRVRQGAAVMTLTGGKPLGDDVRVIAGTVLSGRAVGGGGFLGHYTWTVTCLPEGRGRRDLFGWALPQLARHSASRAVFSWLRPKAEYELDARVHGGERAIVNIGQWEAMTPLDILPTFLVRAIKANDLEEAIDLGLLELTEEDVALCTFADPCKIDVGRIIRKGLDMYEKEGGA